jgi:hypothetical protein
MQNPGGMAKEQPVISAEHVAARTRIYLIRGKKVMFSRDLAALYGIASSTLNQKVKNNIKRFPEDYAFQLTRKEFNILLTQIAMPGTGRGGRCKLPWVLTEDGVAMLSILMRDKRVVQVNRAIDWHTGARAVLAKECKALPETT